MKNEYGVTLERSGYAPSVVQKDPGRCFLCGKRNQKLDRHEPFGGPMREKSKRLGIWVLLCHSECHQGNSGVHKNAELARRLKQRSQQAAMQWYGWSEEDWHREFGKSFLEN